MTGLFSRVPRTVFIVQACNCEIMGPGRIDGKVAAFVHRADAERAAADPVYKYDNLRVEEWNLEELRTKVRGDVSVFHRWDA